MVIVMVNHAPRHTSVSSQPSGLLRHTKITLDKWFSVSHTKKFEKHCSRSLRLNNLTKSISVRSRNLLTES